jgi:hypothetical protein
MFDILISDAQRANIAIIMASENFSMRDIVKYGLISLGYAMSPHLYSCAESLPFHTWVPLILSTFKQKMNLEDIVLAGVMTLARLNGPDVWSGELSPSVSTAGERLFFTPRIMETTTLLFSTGFFSACLANSQLLGLDPHSIMKDDAMSPFSRKSRTDSDSSTRTHGPEFAGTTVPPRQVQSHGLTNDMCPTIEQLAIPHHPYLDIIPWPSFRARAIVASSMDPPLIDEGDLCLDLLSNGLCCSSVRGVSLNGRGEGTPWDSRSWEAKPWFLRKWSLLTSGSDVQQSSAWWRSRS